MKKREKISRTERKQQRVEKKKKFQAMHEEKFNAWVRKKIASGQIDKNGNLILTRRERIRKVIKLLVRIVKNIFR